MSQPKNSDATGVAPITAAVTLKPATIGFSDSVVIGLAATSPAYTLAAVIGPLVATVGLAAPGMMLLSFIPMFLIASAFYYLNLADRDCGTTFSWVTRAMGPWFGWIGGWAITMTGVLIIGSVAEVGVRFFLLAIGLDDLAADPFWMRVMTVLVVLVMTSICVIGTEVSARLQNILIVAQTLALIIFAVVAIWRAYDGSSDLSPVPPAWDWLNPFAGGTVGLTAGLLLGVFAYWGWESAVNLNEETGGKSNAAGKAALVSTIILVLTYVAIAVAVIAYAGVDFLAENAGEEEAIFAVLSEKVLGDWSWIVLIAVSTSAIASTQTTIIPASRTALSMARRAAIPASLAKIHPKYRTPAVSTWTVAFVAIGFYLIVGTISENAMWDTIAALSLLIAFYYALTGLACAICFRRELTKSVRNFLFIGVGPVIGAVILLWLLVASIIDMSDPETSATGVAWLGLAPPLVIGIIIFALGLVLMLIWRMGHPGFWRERPSIADPASLTGAITIITTEDEEAVTPTTPTA